MKKYDDPVKHFAYTRWHKINARTVNGRNPDLKTLGSRRYIEHGITMNFTREEFNLWCENNREIIISILASGDIPSVDRIDDDGHYVLANMRIVPLKVNIAAGLKKRNRIRSERLAGNVIDKMCLVCNTPLERKKRPGGQMEKFSEFAVRQTCGAGCQIKLRLRNKNGDFIKGKRVFSHG